MKTIAITGVLGYSGRYIAAEAVRRGWKVIGLTDSAERLPNPAGYELRPMPWSPGGEHALRGADVLVNTYWVRFDYKGLFHSEFSHLMAVLNTQKMFHAAKEAGVKRIVHTSITNPAADSWLPYFSGKARLESSLVSTGIPHSILRPPVLFGESPQESILINNMAWCLRYLPCVGTFGLGHYRLQPIHVQDFAELAMNEAEGTAQSRVVQAIGPETYNFRELWQMLAEAIGVRRLILPVPSWLGHTAAYLIGQMMEDVMLTRYEIAGLMQDRLAVTDAPPAGQRSLRDWAAKYAHSLGKTYQSELARRKRAK